MENNAYQVTELFSDLKNGIWSELRLRKPIDVYRRNLQKSYIGILNNLLNPSSPSSASGGGVIITIPTVSSDKSDIKSIVRAHLSSLKSEISAAAIGTNDAMTRYHLQDLIVRINNALNPKQ